MATNTTANAPPQSLSETPDFINSLAEIRKLSTALSSALSAFSRRYDELQNHLKTAIHSKLPDQLNQLALIPIPPDTLPVPDSLTNSEPKTDSEKQNVQSKAKCQTNLKSKPESEKPFLKLKPESTRDSVTEANCEKPARSELENLCQKMDGRSLKRYITVRLSDSTKLREEVPKALTLSVNPPMLILKYIGRFYLQGSRAYIKESHMTEHRRASVLALECFLLMGRESVEIENDVEIEAAKAAVAWGARIDSEGGFDKAAEIDARGLLMLISGFGIPKVFTDEDIRELIMATRVNSISSALRRSSYLVTRIPSIVELMVKKNLEVKAADIAFSLGLEDKCCPKKILTTFLHHTLKSKMQGSSEEVRTAKRKQLADLKSIIRCLKDHKIDLSDLLPESKMNEQVTSLMKEITELDKKAAKRKATETGSLKYWISEDAKRSRFPGSNIYDHSTSPSISRGFKHLEDITNGSILNTSPYSRVYSQPPAGPMISQPSGGQSLSYAAAPSQGDAAALLSERLLSQGYAGHSYAAAPTALSERLVSHGYGGQTYGLQASLSGLSSLYRPSHLQTSLEGFAGLPSHSSSTTSAGVWNRGLGGSGGSDLYQFADSVGGSRGGGSGCSELYQFADSVVESESYNTKSKRTGGVHRSSYLF